MNVTLITGGCGFLGRNLIKELSSEPGRHIYVIDDLTTGQHPAKWLPAELIPDSNPERTYITASGATVTFLQEDTTVVLSERNHWSPLCRRNLYYDEVYHLAAQVGGRISLEHQPMKTARNLQTDAAFFAWVVRSKDRIGRVLYMSSSAAYPMSLQQEELHRPLSEHVIDNTRAVDVDGIYGWCKLTGEYLARKAAERTGVSIGCVRLFSGYGPDQDLSYPVPALGTRAAARSDPLLVWGSGKQCRDFIYISDCIAGMRRAIERISGGDVVNLGTGVGTPLGEVARTLAELAGYQPKLATDLTKPVGASVRVADVQKMRDRLDWFPETHLEDGLRSVIENAASSA